MNALLFEKYLADGNKLSTLLKDLSIDKIIIMYYGLIDNDKCFRRIDGKTYAPLIKNISAPKRYYKEVSLMILSGLYDGRDGYLEKMENYIKRFYELESFK